MSAKTFLTDFGLPGLQLVPYGLHTCYFYDTDEELIAALSQYFAAGLRNRERCIWITAEPINAGRAREALSRVGFDVADVETSGALMIRDQSEWYSGADGLQGNAVAGFWLEEEERALAKGFNGLRITGDTRFLTRESWATFMEYERTVDKLFDGRRIVALCPYQRRIGPSDMLDVVRCHECALERVDEQSWQVLSGDASGAGVQS